MWALTKEFRFEAAHRLPWHDGKCARMHGHSWRADVELHALTLIEAGAQQGMVADFGIVKHYVQPIVDGHLDHWCLNDTVAANPTSEVVARWLFERIHAVLPPAMKAMLAAVTVHETCTCAARYSP